MKEMTVLYNRLIGAMGTSSKALARMSAEELKLFIPELTADIEAARTRAEALSAQGKEEQICWENNIISQLQELLDEVEVVLASR